ncbi:MAG TPA: ABC transporter permease [Mariprofundaceae bacterium]|nr:ABC transporter permease [Mariprofundaceae bacterium]
MQSLGFVMRQMNRRADAVGSVTVRLASGVGRFFRLLLSVLGFVIRGHWLRRPAVINVLIRQIYFTGVQSLPWVIVISLAVGVLAVYNIVVFAKSVEDLSLIGRMVSGLMVEEAAPLMVTIFLLARSGVAVVTEIGTMHVRGEDQLLRSLGINSHEYLFLPRALAFAVCGLILTFIFTLISVWVGGLVVSWSYELNFIDFLVEVRRGTSLGEMLMMFGKGAVFPVFCVLMLMDQGCRVGRDPNRIPVRATNGVLGSLMLVLLLDTLLALAESVL